MATHEQNIEALRTAVYGASVRNAMVELFEEDYMLVKDTITFGTAITSESSSIVGYTDGSVYVNTNTWNVYQCNGIKWILKGNIRGPKGYDGSGNKWYTGNKISGKFTDDRIFQYSEISYAYVGDLYLNVEEGAIYKCVEGGSNFLAKWRYLFTIQEETAGDMKMDVYANSGDVGVVNKANALTEKAVDGSSVWIGNDGKLRARTYGYNSFLEKVAEEIVWDSTNGIDLELEYNTTYILVCTAMRNDTKVLRGSVTYLIATQPENSTGSKVPIQATLGTAGSSGQTVTPYDNGIMITAYKASGYDCNVTCSLYKVHTGGTIL